MWQMVASQVVISAKKAGKGDNLRWPQSKDEKYRGCNRWNGYVLAGGDGLRGGGSLRCTEKGGHTHGSSFGFYKGSEHVRLLNWTKGISGLFWMSHSY